MPVSSIPPTVATNKTISLMPYEQYLVCTERDSKGNKITTGQCGQKHGKLVSEVIVTPALTDKVA